MLHALLAESGHAREAFLGACAGLVACDKYCVADAGTWRVPPIDYGLIPPESLDIRSTAQLVPRETDGQRWVTLQIAVSNPEDRGVLVAEPSGWVVPRTFYVDVRGPTGGLVWEESAIDSSTLFFRPHETKSRLLEFRIRSDLSRNHVPSGILALRGGYARRLAGYDTVRATP
jgi:hypothetical protein